MRNQGRGEILVSLCHQPAANRLTVVVLKARNLPKMDVTGLCGKYIQFSFRNHTHVIVRKEASITMQAMTFRNQNRS